MLVDRLVVFLDLVPRPAAHRICFKKYVAASIVLLPDLQLAFLLESPDQYRIRPELSFSLYLVSELCRYRLFGPFINIEHIGHTARDEKQEEGASEYSYNKTHRVSLHRLVVAD